MRKKSLLFLVIGLIFALMLSGCGNSGKQGAPSGKLQVVTSIYPLQDFTEKIGGNHVQVTNLVPPGVEPHDYDLTPQDLTRLSQSDLFIYNGAGLEPYADKVKQALDPARTRVVNATQHIRLLSPSEEGAQREGDSSFRDPHVWLDPVLAKQEALAIRDALIQKDPKHRTDYERNYAHLAQRFDQLDQELKEIADQAPQKEFAVSHAAFGYLAKRYGLHQLSISGLSPEDEPSPRELEQIIRQVRAHHIHVILFETLVSGKMAEVVKKDVKAEAGVLNPIEGLTKEEKAQGKDYFALMDENKKNLAKALGVSR
jgi:zinc transport system substrate-binding protein